MTILLDTYYSFQEQSLPKIRAAHTKEGGLLAALFNLMVKLPGNVISLYIVPLDPAHRAGLARYGSLNESVGDHFIRPSTASHLIFLKKAVI